MHFILSIAAASGAALDISLASGGLLVSRAGLRPLALQEAIVLLSSVHFHYSGFATAPIAMAGFRLFQRHLARATVFSKVVWLVLLLAPALAEGS